MLHIYVNVSSTSPLPEARSAVAMVIHTPSNEPINSSTHAHHPSPWLLYAKHIPHPPVTSRNLVLNHSPVQNHTALTLYQSHTLLIQTPNTTFNLFNVSQTPKWLARHLSPDHQLHATFIFVVSKTLIWFISLLSISALRTSSIFRLFTVWLHWHAITNIILLY